MCIEFAYIFVVQIVFRNGTVTAVFPPNSASVMCSSYLSPEICPLLPPSPLLNSKLKSETLQAPVKLLCIRCMQKSVDYIFQSLEKKSCSYRK